MEMHLPKAVEQLLRFLQQMAKFQHNFAILILAGIHFHYAISHLEWACVEMERIEYVIIIMCIIAILMTISGFVFSYFFNCFFSCSIA